ncbi:hypothetical protein ACFQS1_12005 [Paractinoplanes rhizophilus]|uniref:Uncharacterized protein n=1 Tax=Paractinoplanes rhizophilus TaxID=1416877 RepID=A0ABW2HSI8_9ACTN
MEHISRDRVVIATKFGLLSHRGGDGGRQLDSHPDNIRAAVRLTAIAPPAGDRYANMSEIGR